MSKPFFYCVAMSANRGESGQLFESNVFDSCAEAFDWAIHNLGQTLQSLNDRNTGEPVGNVTSMDQVMTGFTLCRFTYIEGGGYDQDDWELSGACNDAANERISGHAGR